jgi:hypothetical protein
VPMTPEAHAARVKDLERRGVKCWMRNCIAPATIRVSLHTVDRDRNRLSPDRELLMCDKLLHRTRYLQSSGYYVTAVDSLTLNFPGWRAGAGRPAPVPLLQDGPC